MSDYSKMKNAELESLLKDRGLAHTGKKAELIKRLQDHDSSAAAPNDTSKTLEDEIDWDDEPATTESTKPISEPAAAALAAGGQGQPPNPQAVPNQIADIDPSKTDDLTVANEPTASTDPESTSTAAAAAAPEQREKTPVDFSSGLATTTVEQEIEKRKARAKKFGLDESSDEALKALERAKKFGGTELSSKLNEALPERREKKRGREPEDAGRGGKRGRPGMSDRRDSSRRNAERPQAEKTQVPARSNGAKGSWMNEADKAKAEARKAKFASA